MEAFDSGAARRRVIAFWFGDPASADFGKEREMWWRSTPEFDIRVADVLGADFAAAEAGRLDTLKETAEGCLALVILLDQFPRNVFRGTPRAFATDRMARAVTGHAVSEGLGRTLRPVMRAFLYIPLEHSEDLADQERSVSLYKDLGLPERLDYALGHRDIIARFGRFPHRNVILGRESTAEEREFLVEPGSSF